MGRVGIQFWTLSTDRQGHDTPRAVPGVRLPAVFRLLVFAFSLQVSALSPLFADTHYVWTNSPSATPPYTNWASAAHVIQDAVDAAVDGDTVLVEAGVYDTGTRFSLGLTRVVVDKPIRVSSVVGPKETFIMGGGTPDSSPVRGVHLAGGATLVGFTVARGCTDRSWDDGRGSGGGIKCDSDSSIVSNCIIRDCWSRFRASAIQNGTVYRSGMLNNETYHGTSYSCNLYSCFASRNIVMGGGGSARGNVYNCTFVDNYAWRYGGGCHEDTVVNSIVYYNEARARPETSNCGDCTVSYTCTFPLHPGTSNITVAPLLTTFTNPHLFPGSACIDAGNGNALTGECVLVSRIDP